MQKLAGEIEIAEGARPDLPKLEGVLKGYDAEIDQLAHDQSLEVLRKDETKQKAIQEAFVAKYVLSFGLRMSTELEEHCESHGMTIDAFLDGFGKKQRLADAVTNLAYGYADSNDLSVIFAESNAGADAKDKQTKILHEFVEEALKPNIAELYQHASKVDVIYQANLTGLGTPFHSTRTMVRDAHDKRIGALFGDAMGVESQIHSLSIQGAVDVARQLDFYMERHGGTYLSDAKIHDGIASKGARVRKAVSVVSDDEMDGHIQTAKSARRLRQSAPDISDMFVRICGYDYFYPQAPNSASHSNIMVDNPEAPASYVMVNNVVKGFIEKLALGDDINQFRKKVGSQLDNMLAQTFMDFFNELGHQHAADHKIGQKRAQLKGSAKESSTHGFVFDSYTKLITQDALGKFDLFEQIYAANLQKQLETAPKKVAAAIQGQINALDVDPREALQARTAIRPGTETALRFAYLENHTLENTSWRGSAAR